MLSFLNKLKQGVLQLNQGVMQDVEKVYNAIPELKTKPRIMGETLSLAEFPNLRYIIHTGIETHNGMHRFKDILCYYSDVSPSSETAGTISIIDSSSGSLKTTLTESDLLAKCQQVVSGLNLAADDRVLLACKSRASSTEALAFGTVACALNLAKMVIPSSDFNQVTAQSVIETESCNAAVGDWKPPSLKSWAP